MALQRQRTATDGRQAGGAHPGADAVGVAVRAHKPQPRWLAAQPRHRLLQGCRGARGCLIVVHHARDCAGNVRCCRERDSGNDAGRSIAAGQHRRLGGTARCRFALGHVDGLAAAGPGLQGARQEALLGGAQGGVRRQLPGIADRLARHQ